MNASAWFIILLPPHLIWTGEYGAFIWPIYLRFRRCIRPSDCIYECRFRDQLYLVPATSSKQQAVVCYPVEAGKESEVLRLWGCCPLPPNWLIAWDCKNLIWIPGTRSRCPHLQPVSSASALGGSKFHIDIHIFRDDSYSSLKVLLAVIY